MSILDRSSPDNADASDTSTGTRAALLTGTLAGAAMLWAWVTNRRERRECVPASSLPPALDAEVRALDLMEGTVRYYHRPGTGPPVVMLHSLNAAASSVEMEPIFEHLASSTDRPLFAMDWLGFGISDRPGLRYRPAIFIRQLRRLLSEPVGTEADVVALSLGCEYAASVAAAFPFLVRRLACIAPTGLSDYQGTSGWRRPLVNMAGRTGVFEFYFYRITGRASLRDFYERQIFLDSERVPDRLVEQAYRTTRSRGAHRAPRYFVNGDLFLDARARRAYAELRTPTLFVVPEQPGPTIQSFERLDQIVSSNGTIEVRRLPGGLMPHWEQPAPLFDALDRFVA